MVNKDSIRKLSSAFMALLIATLLIMTTPAQAAYLTNRYTYDSSTEYTEISVTVTKEDLDLLENGTVLDQLVVNLTYPAGTTVTLNNSEATLTTTGTYGYGYGYVIPNGTYDNSYGFNTAGSSLTFTWNLSLAAGTYTVNSYLDSTTNDADTFTISDVSEYFEVYESGPSVIGTRHLGTSSTRHVDYTQNTSDYLVAFVEPSIPTSYQFFNSSNGEDWDKIGEYAIDPANEITGITLTSCHGDGNKNNFIVLTENDGTLREDTFDTSSSSYSRSTSVISSDIMYTSKTSTECVAGYSIITAVLNDTTNSLYNLTTWLPGLSLNGTVDSVADTNSIEDVAVAKQYASVDSWFNYYFVYQKIIGGDYQLAVSVVNLSGTDVATTYSPTILVDEGWASSPEFSITSVDSEGDSIYNLYVAYVDSDGNLTFANYSTPSSGDSMTEQNIITTNQTPSGDYNIQITGDDNTNPRIYFTKDGAVKKVTITGSSSYSVETLLDDDNTFSYVNSLKTLDIIGDPASVIAFVRYDGSDYYIDSYVDDTNHAPTVSAVWTDKDTIIEGESVYVYANVTDIDGDLDTSSVVAVTNSGQEIELSNQDGNKFFTFRTINSTYRETDFTVEYVNATDTAGHTTQTYLPTTVTVYNSQVVNCEVLKDRYPATVTGDSQNCVITSDIYTSGVNSNLNITGIANLTIQGDYQPSYSYNTTINVTERLDLVGGINYDQFNNNLEIYAGTLNITGHIKLDYTDEQVSPSPNKGYLRIQVDEFYLDEGYIDGKSSNLRDTSTTIENGDSGTLTINASTSVYINNSRILSHGGYVNSDTGNNTAGNGGELTIISSGNCNISNSNLTSYGGHGNTSATNANVTAGNGSNINITATRIYLTDSNLESYGGFAQILNGAVSTKTYAGNGGNITLDADFVKVTNSVLNASGGFAYSDFGAGACSENPGNAGHIFITSGYVSDDYTSFADSTFYTEGGDSVTSSGTGGAGGNINLTYCCGNTVGLTYSFERGAGAFSGGDGSLNRISNCVDYVDPASGVAMYSTIQGIQAGGALSTVTVANQEVSGKIADIRTDTNKIIRLCGNNITSSMGSPVLNVSDGSLNITLKEVSDVSGSDTLLQVEGGSTAKLEDVNISSGTGLIVNVDNSRVNGTNIRDVRSNNTEFDFQSHGTFNITNTSVSGIDFGTYSRSYKHLAVNASSGWVMLNVTYNESLLGVSESNYELYKYNAIGWSAASSYAESSGIDTTNNYVWANTTSFSVFEPLADVGETDAPTVVINGPENTTYSSNSTDTIDFNFTVTDASSISKVIANVSNSTSHIREIELFDDGSGSYVIAPGASIEFPDAVYNMTAFANDTYNNINNTGWVVFTVDTTAPKYYTVSDNSSGTVENGTTVKVSSYWNDSLSNMSVCQVLLNDTGSFTVNSTSSIGGSSGWCNTTIDTSDMANQYVCWKAYANDSNNHLNNSMSAQCFSVTEATEDTTPPTITIALPANTTYNSTSRTLNVSATETIDTWQYSLNGASNVTFTPNTTLTAAEGFNNLTVYANDTAGNLNSTTKYFTIDSTAPTVTINSPSNITYSTNNTTTIGFNVTAIDATTSVDTVQANFTNSTSHVGVVTLDNTPGTNYYVYTGGTELPDEVYNMTVIANDTAGNINNTQSVVFTVNISYTDTTAPSVSASASPTSLNTGGTVNITVTATDANGIDTVLFEQSGTNYSATGSSGNTYWWTGATTATTGTKTVTVYANDTYNNFASDSTTYTVTAAPSGGGSGSSSSGYVAPTQEEEHSTDRDVINLEQIDANEPYSTNETFYFVDMILGTILADRDYSNVWFDMEEVSKPVRAFPPENPVYKYFKLEYTGFREVNLIEASFKARVPKHWMDENGIYPSRVTALRYNGEEWEELRTNYIGEEDGYYYFRVYTERLSYFAITGDPVEVWDILDSVERYYDDKISYESVLDLLGLYY